MSMTTNWNNKLLLFTIAYILKATCFQPKVTRGLVTKFITTATNEDFLKSKDIVDLCKDIFSISKLFIQCNTGYYCVHITGGVDIYLYVYVSLCPACVCVYNIKLEHWQKRCHPCQTFSKFDALLHKKYATRCCWY